MSKVFKFVERIRELLPTSYLWTEKQLRGDMKTMCDIIVKQNAALEAAVKIGSSALKYPSMHEEIIGSIQRNCFSAISECESIASGGE